MTTGTDAQLNAGQIRRIFLARQQLTMDPGRRLATDELRQMIGRLGFVQVDSVNTVERAHHMILYARNQTYRPKMLDRLLESDRALFENWTHDASVIPSEFWPIWKHKFRRDGERLRTRWRQWRREGFEELFDATLEHVARNGPTRTRDLQPEGKHEAGWWNWKPEKTALEFQWRTGALAVCRREGFEKLFDLSERVIPEPHLSSEVDHDSFVDWCCREALQRLGVATHGELAAFWGILKPDEARLWAEKGPGRDLPRIEAGALDGSRPRLAIADPSALDSDADAVQLSPRVRVISPFDPVLRDRKRAMRLFNFDYRIEIFVPEPKRKYGYYVFPLLEGERFVGRIDMRRDGPGGPLKVRKVWWEAGVRKSKGRVARLESELERVRRFSGASDVVWASDAMA